jgi:hypothetical protein
MKGKELEPLQRNYLPEDLEPAGVDPLALLRRE